MHYLSQIYRYTTVSTSNAVFIIGGQKALDNQNTDFLQTSDTIYQFKDDVWSVARNLNKKRSWHGSIAVGDEVMILGGRSDRLIVLFSLKIPVKVLLVIWK